MADNYLTGYTPNYYNQNWLYPNYNGMDMSGYYNLMGYGNYPMNYNPTFGASQTQANQQKTPTENIGYVAINEKTGCVDLGKNIKICQGSKEKIAEYKKKVKKDDNTRALLGIVTIIASLFLACKYGAKYIDPLVEKINVFARYKGKRLSNEVLDYIECGIAGTGSAICVIPGLTIATSNRTKKKLMKEYFPENTTVQKSEKSAKKA